MTETKLGLGSNGGKLQLKKMSTLYTDDSKTKWCKFHTMVTGHTRYAKEASVLKAGSVFMELKKGHVLLQGNRGTSVCLGLFQVFLC